MMNAYLPNKLGLFLLETVLYPGEQKNLHVFEPRYKEMIADCISKDIPFVVVRGNQRHMEEIGCTAHIERVLAQYPDGRVDIAAEGRYRVQIIRVDREKLYQQGVVEEYGDAVERSTLSQKEQLIAQHIKLLEFAGRKIDPQYYQSKHPISWLIGRNCGLSLDQRQELLELRSERRRIQFLTKYLKELIPKVLEKQEIHKRIMSNGYFKDFPPGEN